MAATTLISLEHYLIRSYTPDVEYIDGVLCEKPITGYPHGVIQVVIAEWFRTRRREWDISCSIEPRTKVSPSRVRLPDIVVIKRGTAPKRTLSIAPILAIEVRSPSDRMSGLKNRANDLASLGTKNIWLIHPRKKTISLWDSGCWTEAKDKIIPVLDHPPMYLDMEWVWREVADSQ